MCVESYEEGYDEIDYGCHANIPPSSIDCFISAEIDKEILHSMYT